MLSSHAGAEYITARSPPIQSSCATVQPVTLLPDFRLETYFSRWEFKAKYNLCASDIETVTLRELLALADGEHRDAWDELRLGYVETFGSPALREAIADTYEHISPHQVLAFAGAEEGIFAAMQVLLAPDDHAIVIIPNYQSAETLPASICAVTGIALDADRNWRLDLDRVRDAIRPNTRLISINFPHNPTGSILLRDDFDSLVEIARSRGLYLFSDEVYRLIERDPERRLPQAADAYEKGLSLNVLSKAYGLAGLRVGWIATRDTALLGRMERVKHYLSICNSAPGEALAVIALTARDAILDRNRAIVDSNLSVLDAFFARHRDLFDWTIPDGGSIGFPRYLGRDGVDAFCERLVQQTGVLLLPGSVYRSTLGPTPTDRFRVGYGRRNLPEAVDVLERYLSAARDG